MRNPLHFLVIGGLILLSMPALVGGAPKSQIQGLRSEIGTINFMPSNNQIVVSDVGLRFDEKTIIVDQLSQRLSSDSLEPGMLVKYYRAPTDNSGYIERIELVR